MKTEPAADVRPLESSMCRHQTYNVLFGGHHHFVWPGQSEILGHVSQARLSRSIDSDFQGGPSVVKAVLIET